MLQIFFAYYDVSVFKQIMSNIKISPFSTKQKKPIYTKSDKDNFVYPFTAWGMCKHLEVKVKEPF
ncbi:hypothetical protein Indivirus_11_7 [Indivirus ILV1]|uniref:Uncharacterized protein n=1 Tax=Indivirus ILV1 TaxID=1977633 RepID=A0A1V0SEC2_9VIRU|nr:hypothetical protein Indivirus_11_7 [Indivirus ILV1]